MKMNNFKFQMGVRLTSGTEQPALILMITVWDYQAES